ncbi:MAG: L-ribulose-5-phosphate 4-epimerase, partial [Microbacteriaceae bacterium]|nr:L-ribulose-5-phosphate 4-epimerase [Microbacteriaceae bacterium]
MSTIEEKVNAVRADVAKLHETLVRHNLVIWSRGNISPRVPGAE